MDQSDADLAEIDFTQFAITKKIIAINGKKLPIAIDDKLTMPNGVVKTVMGIMIHEDGRIQFVLEWLDPNSSSVQSETLSLMELKLLNFNSKRKKNPIGYK